MWQTVYLSPAFAVSLAAFLGAIAGGGLCALAHYLPRSMEARWAEQCREYLASREATLPGEAPSPDTADDIPTAHAALAPSPELSVPPSWPAMLATALVCALLFVLCAWRFGGTPLALAGMVLLGALLLLGLIDFGTSLLPDSITLPLLWAGLLVNLQGGLTSLPQAVLGAVVGYLCLWLLFHAFKFCTGREGMGHGDFKLLAALGAWLGLSALPMLLLVSSISGVIIGLTLVRLGRAARGQALPFGPYLAVAGAITLLGGGYAGAPLFGLG